ncbi:hypothetical protein FGB62_30g22 [Gracilaria domingensis]|nr:hypothetical protein FGB62_30g22 [Gracilaria domingensis]
MRRAPRRAFALDAIATGCRPPAREAAKARAPGMVPAAHRAAAYRATAASLARVVPPVIVGAGAGRSTITARPDGLDTCSTTSPSGTDRRPMELPPRIRRHGACRA